MHVPSGTTANATTNSSGQFSATGLRVGGPYRVTAQAEGMQEASVEDLYTELAQRSSVTLVAQPIAQLAGVEVTGASERDMTIGAGSRFGAQDIRELPSISRDIKDVVRIDPKAWIDPTNSDALEVAGVNNRYNSITIDGVRQSDDFGLNNNGYPTQRSPLSVEAIEDVSILTAPFSVEYGILPRLDDQHRDQVRHQRIHGFGLLLQGQRQPGWATAARDTDLTFVFDEETYGGTLGGPIMKDKLFFFLSYEKLDRKAPQDFGAGRLGIPRSRSPGVTQAEYDQIRRDRATTVYGFDTGERFDQLPEKDEKILGEARLEHQRLPARVAVLPAHRGQRVSSYDQQQPGDQRISAPSNWYNRAITDGFGVPAAVLGLERVLLDRAQGGAQGSRGPPGFPDRHRLRARCRSSTTPSGGHECSSGPDEFRHANFLTNDLDAIKLKGSFFLGDHTLMVGYEREMLDIFNIFVPRSRASDVFASIDDFREPGRDEPLATAMRTRT